MRTVLAVSLLAAVVSLSACGRPSYTKGVRSLGSSLKTMGKNAAAIAGVDVKLDVDAKAIVKDQVKKQVDQRIAAIAPISIQHSVHRTQVDADEPAAQPPRTRDVEPTIVRRDVSGGGASEQVWKNLSRAGEKATCEKVDSFDACSATCGEHMRQESMRQLQPNAGKPQTCECTQGYNKCS